MAEHTQAHGHSHSHVAADPRMLDTEEGIRVTRNSFLVMLATVIFQAVVVSFSGSAALLADTLHNLVDMTTSIPLWIAFRLTQRQASRRFSYGYSRAEDLAGLLILLLIIASAVFAAYESIQKLVEGDAPRYLPWAIAAGIVGVIGNEAVAQYRINAGRRIGSAALVADGQHARTDGLTSLAAVVGLAGVALGWPAADPLAGLAVTGVILYVAYAVGRELLARLMDAIEPEVIEQIEHISRTVPGVLGVHDTRARWSGHRVLAELHIDIDGQLPLVKAHQIGEEVRHRLLHDIAKLSDVVLHFDPVPDSPEHHAATAHHFTSEGAPEGQHSHDDSGEGHQHTGHEHRV